MKKIILLFIIITSTSYIYAQQAPFGIDWRKIDAGNYEIIYPSTIEQRAQYVANLMNHYEPYNYNSYTTSPRKIPIVLINTYSVPNGFVSFAPFYSHWYTTPSDFSGTEWFKNLAIHEGRHMVQQNKLREGIGKKLWNIAMGDLGTGVFSVIYIPFWFLEGDAVMTETAFTKYGRGRIAGFSLWHRTLELSGERYSYYRNFLGAPHDLVPYNDYYRSGYLLTAYVRNRYGKDSWDRVLSRTGKYCFFPAFFRAVDHVTGSDINSIYEAAMDEHRQRWLEQLRGIRFTKGEKITHKKDTREWISYVSPVSRNKDEIHALYFSRDRVPSLCNLTDEGYENLLQLPLSVLTSSFRNEKRFSFGGDNFIYIETTTDPRWGYRSYSNLKLYNFKTGKIRKFSNEGKYLSTALSHDGNSICAIEYGNDLKFRLKVFSIKSHVPDKVFDLSGVSYAGFPGFSNDVKEVAFVSLSDKGYALKEINLATGRIKDIVKPSYKEKISTPTYYDKYIFYVSDYSGVDNIYAVDRETSKRFQVVSAKFGAYYPSVSKAAGRLYYNDYTVKGYSVAAVKIDKTKWIPFEKVENRRDNYIEGIVKQELEDRKRIDDLENIPDKKYESGKYYPLLNCIKPMGWIPYFDSTDSNFYFIFLSRDVLQTTDLTLNYIYNRNENVHAVQGGVLYSSLYPTLSLSGGYGQRSTNVNTGTSDDPVYESMNWKEKKFFVTAGLPLNIISGIYNTVLNLNLSYGYIDISDKNHEDFGIYNGINRDGNLDYYMASLIFQNYLEYPMNGVGPRWGQELSASYISTREKSNYSGEQVFIKGSIYLPGIVQTHSTMISGSYEENFFENYIFQEQFLFPRGYDSVRYEKFYKFSMDYSFPILSFSLPVWRLVYFKRLKGGIFYDRGVGISGEITDVYSSAGVELTTTVNLLSNYLLLVDVGIMYSRCFNTDENVYSFVLKTPLGNY